MYAAACGVAVLFFVLNCAVHAAICWNYDSCLMFPAAVHVVAFSMQMCNFSFGLICGVFLPQKAGWLLDI